jgi:ABC-type dipeptide/oligopeptide/nickel transport system permease subunit
VSLAVAYEAGSVTPRWLLRVGWGRVILLVTLSACFFGLVGYSILSPGDPHERYLAPTPEPSRGLPSMPAVPRIGAGFDTYAPISLQHSLGTDQRGRDLLLRLAHGARTSLIAGLVCTVCFLFLGVTFGVMGGYVEGPWRAVSIFLLNLVNNFPILLLLLLSVIIVDSLVSSEWLPLRGYLLMALLGVFSSPKLSELIRGHIRSLKETAYVQAAVALGLSSHTIVGKHILWLECRALIVVQAAYIMGQAILIETTLTYLTFGLEHPRVSWGLMIREMASAIFTGEPAVLIVVAAMTASVFYFQLLATVLNVVLSPGRR